ncbi:Bug family tripartite tricarboxylate transporter substrate binding protein [Phreatobacter stygius]|uniref:Tripartite tricarboxylate transporter substrate binding protein n=1 Tax=Phreatobacter stygius TaxID=1940610 RepID=A0A4D7BKQ8_9HYPH|nr:tripartite tricarboxylate transporter substrate binding protein [Phreatobacter stygius]QCI68327.1 tripartite tricarboxylate transporter substrate binding protein [Phreatobacter stygius]
MTTIGAGTARFVLCLLALLPLSFAATGQTGYPQRPVTFIVPYPAGGTTDILARLLAEHLKEKLGQPVVIDNRPGAGTTIGAGMAARAEPDGHTLLMATSTTLAINASLFQRLPYDPVADFAPVSLVAGVPLILIVNPALNIKTLAEFVAYAKSKPGELAYGSAGNGTPHHLAGELLKTVAGIEARHVAYRGSVVAMNDVIGGHIPFMFMDMAPALPLIAAGKLTALAVSAPRRVAAAPTIPTVAEAGYPGYEAVAWQAVVVPARTRSEIVARLHAEISSFLSSPANRDKLIQIGLEPLGGSSQDLVAYIKSEIARWALVVRSSGARVE